MPSGSFTPHFFHQPLSRQLIILTAYNPLQTASCCSLRIHKAAATRGTFLLALATQHLFLVLQRLWNQNVACVASQQNCWDNDVKYSLNSTFCNMLQILVTPGYMCNRLRILLQNSFEDVKLPVLVENHRCSLGLTLTRVSIWWEFRSAP